jgi:hypothetical protein
VIHARKPSDFDALRTGFERALDESLAGLDREHYPESLLACMSAALKGGARLRGVPLLLSCLSGTSEPDSRLRLAGESFLRAFLLTAWLAAPEAERAGDGLGRRLAARFSPAELLLTADTLFTWPFELLAGFEERDVSPAARAARALGAQGCLGELDAAGADLEGLPGLDPAGGLARALIGLETGLTGFARDLSRWIYCREAEDWFGGLPKVTKSLEQAAEKLRVSTEGDRTQPGVTGLVGLWEYLSA